MTRPVRLLLAAGLVAAAAGPAAAQPPAARPAGTPVDVAAGRTHSLVLSGGGARGISHAGAIEGLQQLGYDPPLVVGTSMGAIVGALYAAGYEPARIREVVTGENWLQRFSAEPIAFGTGRAPRRSLVGVGIGRRRQPGGLVPTTGVNQRLVELLFDAGARARNDFDSLPRRFRAVATDLGDGRQVVLGAGDLPRAVRASMAVPGAFAPVGWGDRWLADGGISNNLPISVARDVSDRPVLAIDVLQPAPEVTERGAVDIAIRGLRLLIENAAPATAPPEILVVPRIGPGLSEARFPADPGRLLDAGRQAVLEQVPPAAGAPRPAPVTAARPAPGAIAELVILGGDPALRRLAHRIMAPAVGGYDADDIVRRTAGLYRTGLFEAVWPRLEFADTVALLVDLVPVARTSAVAAARWDNDRGTGAWAAARHLLSLHTAVELHATAELDDLGRGAALDGSIFSVRLPGMIWNAGVHTGETRVRLFDADSLAGWDAVRRSGAWLGVERRGSWFVTLLARADEVRQPDDLPDGWAVGPLLRIAGAPRPEAILGVEPLLELEGRAGDLRFARVHARRGVDAGLGRARLAAFADLASASDGAPLDARPAATAGLAPWLRAGARRGQHRATAGVDLAWPLVLDGYVRLRLRAMATADDVADMGAGTAWLGGSELGVAWPTFLGELYTGAAAGGLGGGVRFNVGLGAVF